MWTLDRRKKFGQQLELIKVLKVLSAVIYYRVHVMLIKVQFRVLGLGFRVRV